MIVQENLMMVLGVQDGEKLWNMWFGCKCIVDQECVLCVKVDEVLEFLIISYLIYEKVGNLFGGQKKLFELGCIMMVDVKIVFFDEVGVGVNWIFLMMIGDVIMQLNCECGYMFVVIEYDMDFIGKICGFVICMVEGKVLVEGLFDEIKVNEQVIEVYFGIGLKNKDKVGV